MDRFVPRVRMQVRTGFGLVLLFLVAGLVGSCGRGTFVGRQYNDLTAYYNTFYNANQAFETGLESVSESGGGVDRTRYLSVFPAPQGGAGESSFEEAIQKSADLLREHPNSEWVDDALLLIGRSRYYQQNYVGAAQKFREVIALNTEREGEARFRLAQTLLAAERYTEAAEALRAGLDQEEDYGDWTARMQVVRGELRVRQENWAEAEAALARGVAGGLPDEVGARASFLLGQVRETLNDVEGAQAAYQQVSEYDPPYALAFAAELGAIEMEGLHGAPERALDRLESLERDDDSREMRAEIARVRARLYQAQGRPDRAKRTLTRVLRGEDAPQGTAEGRTHYDLATLYRDTYEDFSRAAAHFDTAATALSSGPGRASRAAERGRELPRAPSDAATQADRFRGLADRSQAVARMDSLLRLGRLPPAEFQAAVETIRQRRLEEQNAQARSTDQQPRFRGGGRGGAREAPAPSSDQAAVQTRESDAGFLFHRDPTLVQQGRRQFEQTWGDRPLVDNWRRVEAIREPQAAQPSADGPAEAARQESPGGLAAASRVVDVSAVPRDSAGRAEMEGRRAVAQYELANALFRAAERPDSARTWFRRILDETPEHPVVPQALYGLAQTHRVQGDSAAARDVYRRLIDEHPDTPFARRAREQLGMDTAGQEPSGPGSRADSAYARAYEAWRSGAPGTALTKFLTVADAYHETDVAPRALLAAGIVYHRTVRDDTSGGARVQFERYVDSLAQDAELSVRRPPQRGSAGQTPAPDRPSPDSATAPATRPADTTTRTGPARAVNPSAADTSEADPSPDPTRRMLDSTAVADRDSSGTSPDGAVTPTRAANDTTPQGPQPSAPDTTASGPGESEDVSASEPDAPAQAESTDPFAVLLAYLADHHSGAPEAERAQALLAQLQKQRAARGNPREDSAATETPAEDRVGVDTAAAAAPDTTATENSSRLRRAPRDSAARPRRASPSRSRSGEEPRPPRRRRDASATPAPADSARSDTSRSG